MLDLLTRYLTKEGYLTVAVSSGDEGLQRAREIIPLAIILDVVMPSKDGWAVLQEIKSDPALEDVPVVMHTMVDDKNFGLAVGASEYLTKPVDKEKILHVIQRLTPKVKRSYVLVVDDDSDARTTICRPIEKAGWEVRTADNGKSAIAILEKEIPGIIFLDLMMPVMDGFEFLALLQSRKGWDQIPVVIVTSKDLSVGRTSTIESIRHERHPEGGPDAGQTPQTVDDACPPHVAETITLRIGSQWPKYFSSKTMMQTVKCSPAASKDAGLQSSRPWMASVQSRLHNLQDLTSSSWT